MRRTAIGRALDVEELHVAVHEMAARGMTDYSIAAATGVSVDVIRRWLGERQP